LNALNLDIKTGKNEFEKIKKMYEKLDKVNKGNEFIVNFENEWHDDESYEDPLK